MVSAYDLGHICGGSSIHAAITAFTRPKPGSLHTELFRSLSDRYCVRRRPAVGPISSMYERKLPLLFSLLIFFLLFIRSHMSKVSADDRLAVMRREQSCMTNRYIENIGSRFSTYCLLPACSLGSLIILAECLINSLRFPEILIGVLT